MLYVGAFGMVTFVLMMNLILSKLTWETAILLTRTEVNIRKEQVDFQLLTRIKEKYIHTIHTHKNVHLHLIQTCVCPYISTLACVNT